MSKPIRFPLAVNVEARTTSTAVDSRIVNGYVEKSGDRTYVIKRPGLLLNSLSPPIAAGVGQGVYPFNGSLYTIISGTLYKIGGAGTVLTPVASPKNLGMWTLGTVTLG